jgi:ribosomal protein S18 acetylase RimI-like enzyme
VHRIAPASGLGQSFGAFRDGALVGTVALEYSAKPKTAHSTLVIGMYVQPAARRLGLARQLLAAAIDAAAARPGPPPIRQLRLTVTEGNTSAIRLYESAGFATWGMEPEAILTPGGYRGKVCMAMALRRA